VERNLALELVRVTEAAALAAARENGRGDEMAPERAAVDAIRLGFGAIGVHGEVVVGGTQYGTELAIGQRLGNSAPESEEVDIALNAVEGGISCALGGPNAMSIVALAPKGGFLRCPAHTYMEKIAVAGDAAEAVSLDQDPTANLKALAEARGVYVEDLTVVILDRPRHDRLVEEVRAAGARVKLIPHGDVAAAMAACRKGSGVDLLLGTGGAPQGVLSAAAIKCMGGFMQCRFRPRSHEEADALYNQGVNDVDRILGLEEMAAGGLLFAATGVTDGEYLRGVHFFRGGARSNSVVMRSVSGTLRLLDTRHKFDYRPDYH